MCNNVILTAYSWAFDKFEQFINRAHRAEFTVAGECLVRHHPLKSLVRIAQRVRAVSGWKTEAF
jgi:hypothetical protein